MTDQPERDVAAEDDLPIDAPIADQPVADDPRPSDSFPPEDIDVVVADTKAAKAGSGRVARPFAWTAGLVMLAMAFASEALPPQRFSFVEPLEGFKWVEAQQVIDLSPYAAFRGPLVFAVSLLLLAWAVLAYNNRRSPRRAAVTVTGEAVEIAYERGWPKKRRFTFDRIGAAQASESETLEIHLRTGAKMIVHTPAARRLARIIERRREGAAHLHAGLGWHAIPWGGALRWLWALGGFYALVGMMNAAGEAVAAGTWVAGALAWLAVILWLGAGFTLSSRTDVVVGSDGVRIAHPWRSQFVPYHLVDDVVVRRGVLRLLRKDGRDVFVSSKNTDRLHRDLQRALDRYHSPEAGGADHHLDALARGDASPEAWRDQLGTILERQDYRGAKLRVADLEQLLGDGQADPEQRVAAALALPKDDETRRRIRLAAARCADEDTRAAIAAAAEDDVATAELARAVTRYRHEA